MVNSPIQPLQDRVIVTRKRPEAVSKGGIIIPETVLAEDKQSQGYVVALGPLVGVAFNGKVLDTKNTVVPEIGSLVMFGEYAGIEVKFQEEQYLVMRESDILAILPQ